MIRVPTYTEPRLAKGANKRTAEGKKDPDKEHRRRKGVRGWNEELSRYYRLAPKRAAWRCPELLLKGKHGRDYLVP